MARWLPGLLTSLTVWFSGTAALACDRELTLGVSEYPPYHIRQADGHWTGMDTDLIAAIVARAGCSLNIVEMDGKRRLAEIKRGRLDMVGAASITPERQMFGLFSSAYRPERMVLFMRQDDPRRNTIKTLSDIEQNGLILAVQPGAFYGPGFAAAHDHLAALGLLVERRGNDDRFLMLARNRVDATPEDLYSGLYTLQISDLDRQIAPSALVMNTEDVHILFSRESVPLEIVTSINAAIGSMRTDGSLQQIMDRYSSLQSLMNAAGASDPLPPAGASPPTQ